MIKIHGEIICQSWPLLTPFFNLPIVQCYKRKGVPQLSEMTIILLSQSVSSLRYSWSSSIFSSSQYLFWWLNLKHKGVLEKKMPQISRIPIFPRPKKNTIFLSHAPSICQTLATQLLDEQSEKSNSLSVRWISGALSSLEYTMVIILS